MKPNITALAKAAGFLPETVRSRIRYGWELDDALSRPLVPRNGCGATACEVDLPDPLADILAGQASARDLAERYDVSRRTICRARARLRAQGRRVRIPEAT